MMVCDFLTMRRIALAVSVTACAAWLLTVQSHHGGHQVAEDFVSSSRLLSSLAGEDDPVHELFPLQTLDYVGFVCAIAGLILSAGAGIGGGGILLPVFILIFKFPIKHAIPLTAVTVLGGAVANNVLNARKTHPKHPNRPAIDWDLIIQLEPMTIAGALIGAGLNNVLPDTVLVVMLFLLLTTTAYKTLQKASQLHAQESEERRREQPLQETAALYQSSNKKEVEEGSDPTDRSRYGAIDPSSSQGSINLDHKKQSSLVWMSAVKLSALFGVVTVLNLLKGKPGNDGGGPLGYCGLHCFWIAEFSMIAIIVVFAIHTRSSILNRVRSGGPILSDIEWDADKTITYPLLAIVAGLVAGLFGVGGGIIKGPLMLALGVHPAVASATCACMILFTSFTATVSFMVFDLLMYDYAAGCFAIGLIATFVGQASMGYLLKKYQRSSLIAFVLGIVVGVSAIAMTVESAIELFYKKPSASLP